MEAMRVQFPGSLRIGTDIVHLPRLLKYNLRHRALERFMARVLHPSERVELDRRFPQWAEYPKPAVLSTSRVPGVLEWLGGRFAAKEAAKKAWGATLVSFGDLRVERQSDGDYQIICTPFRDADHVEGQGEQAAMLSIAHDGDYAIATVLASPLHETIIAELGRRKAEAELKVSQRVADATSRQHRDSDTG